ncbi:MAG: DUF5916 domain-containing protein [bacterium]
MGRRSLFSIYLAITLAIVTHSAPLPATAAEEFTPVYKPTLHIQRALGEIKIDGRLHDPGWQGTAVADNFVENDPGDQIKPPVETRAYMTYDNDHLYVAIVCYDNPEDVRASLCERDRLYGDDNVGFFFDTYGDASWAYTLNVNPYGIQADALWSSGFGEDVKYDLIWESAGQITDSGYQVELAIPFSSLHFPNKEKQTWKVEFWRHHFRDVHHSISWCAYDRDEPCWPCQWGTVTGIENVKPGRGIEIIPAFTGFQSGQLQDISRAEDGLPDSLAFVNDNPDGELSVNAKYSISSNATVEMTFNPDFSQVEADADQIDVNTTTALSFPEKRPFFQEGSDLFRTLYEVVYTRSINDPDFAVKATARLGRTNLAYLGAHDENSPVVVPFEEFSTDPLPVGKSISNIFRVRQSFGDNSRIGFLATDRRYEQDGAGSALSMDGYFRLSQNLNLNWQAIASHTDEPNDTTLTDDVYRYEYDNDTLVVSSSSEYLFDDKHTAAFDGESFWGHGYIGLLNYNARNLYLSGRYSEISPTFRLDNGDETQNDRRQASFIGSYAFRLENGLLKRVTPEIFMARLRDTDGITRNEWVYFNLSTQLREAQAELHSQYSRRSEYYAGKQFDGLWGLHQCLATIPCEMIAVGGNVNYGHQIARQARVIGKELCLGGWLDLKPIDRVFIENWITYIRSQDAETDEELYEGYIVRSRLNIQFSRELSFRFVTQYNDFGETWDFDPLITYRINPFTMFYIGTTYDYEKKYGLNQAKTAYAPEGRYGYRDDRLTSRQFFMKLQYLVQL